MCPNLSLFTCIFIPHYLLRKNISHSLHRKHHSRIRIYQRFSSWKPYDMDTIFFIFLIYKWHTFFLFNYYYWAINTSMGKIFLYKHLAYSLENELRLIISLRMAEEWGMSVPEKGIIVQVDYRELIDHIFIRPFVDSDDINKLYKVCKECGLENKLQDSSLNYTPYLFKLRFFIIIFDG